MPRRPGKRQTEALRSIVANAPQLRSTIQKAQQNANASGGTVTRELQRLRARGDSNATTVLDLMKKGGAGTGDGTG